MPNSNITIVITPYDSMTHTWSLHTWPPFINFSSSCMIGKGGSPLRWWCLTGCRPKSRRCSTVRGTVSPSPLFHFSVHYGQLRNDRRHTGVHPPTFHWSEATASDRWRRGDWRTVHFKGISALFGMDGLSWSWRNEKHVNILIMFFSEFSRFSWLTRFYTPNLTSKRSLYGA